MMNLFLSVGSTRHGRLIRAAKTSDDALVEIEGTTFHVISPVRSISDILDCSLVNVELTEDRVAVYHITYIQGDEGTFVNFVCTTPGLTPLVESIPTHTPGRVGDDAEWRVTLREHQHFAVAWMQERERSREIVYDVGIPIGDEGWVDLERHEVVASARCRMLKLRGGVLADEAGSGKTAMALRLILSTSHEGPTLVVVPTNLPRQWLQEIDKFTPGFRVVTLLNGYHLRTVSMRDICDAHVVLTTASFLRLSRTHQGYVEETVGGDTLAHVRAWARKGGGDAPILRAVDWLRVVVDEAHELLDKDVVWLSTLRARHFWLLTATPGLHTEKASRVRLVLENPNEYHPTMLPALAREATRGHRTYTLPQHTLVRVDAPEALEVTKKMKLKEVVQYPGKVANTSTKGYVMTTVFTEKMSEECCICMEAQSTMLTRCTHAFCPTCITKHLSLSRTCPVCRAHINSCDVFAYVSDDACLKFQAITSLACASTRVIIFSQYKSLLRPVYALLRNKRHPVHLLEGSVGRRVNVIDAYTREGGAILITLNDFAGIRLPRADSIIFAHALVGSRGDIESLEHQALGRVDHCESVHSVVLKGGIEEGAFNMYDKTKDHNTIP